MKEVFPRILVSSVDVWNETSGSDTFTNLLSGYNNENIANIYIRSGKPTSQVCNKYFFISENAVIKSIFKKDYITGMCVQRGIEGDVEQQIEREEQEEKKRYSFFFKHRLWVFIYIREMLWALGRWKSKELNKFIEDYKPEVLFFPIESYIHFNKVNEYLVKKTGLPAVGIIWDDNFTYKPNQRNLGFLIHRYFLRKSVKKNLSYCKKVFSISPKLQKELKEVLGVESELLTKGAKIENNAIPIYKEREIPLKMVYTGKLNYGRFGTVRQVADVLDIINTEVMKVELDIYSGTILTDKEKRLLNRRGVSYKGYVTQDRIKDIQQEADILLFAEALDKKHKYDARLSFSTKTVDYLATYKCIVAVGPEDIAPIEYLSNNNVALIACSKEKLRIILEGVVNNLKLLDEYEEKAYDLVLANHDIKKIQKLLYNVFTETAKERINSK